MSQSRVVVWKLVLKCFTITDKKFVRPANRRFFWDCSPFVFIVFVQCIHSSSSSLLNVFGVLYDVVTARIYFQLPVRVLVIGIGYICRLAVIIKCTTSTNQFTSRASCCGGSTRRPNKHMLIRPDVAHLNFLQSRHPQPT